MKKIIEIDIYDPKVTQAPFKFIVLHTNIEVDEPEDDHLGQSFYTILCDVCNKLGHMLKSYSLSDKEGIDYSVTVYGGLVPFLYRG